MDICCLTSHTHTLLHTDLHAENITRQRCQRLVLIALYKIQKYIYQFQNHVLHYIFGMEDSQGWTDERFWLFPCCTCEFTLTQMKHSESLLLQSVTWCCIDCSDQTFSVCPLCQWNQYRLSKCFTNAVFHDESSTEWIACVSPGVQYECGVMNFTMSRQRYHRLPNWSSIILLSQRKWEEKWKKDSCRVE